jgi:hypothetical protein
MDGEGGAEELEDEEEKARGELGEEEEKAEGEELEDEEEKASGEAEGELEDEKPGEDIKPDGKDGGTEGLQPLSSLIKEDLAPGTSSLILLNDSA